MVDLFNNQQDEPRNKYWKNLINNAKYTITLILVTLIYETYSIDSIDKIDRIVL